MKLVIACASFIAIDGLCVLYNFTLLVHLLFDTATEKLKIVNDTALEPKHRALHIVALAVTSKTESYTVAHFHLIPLKC